MTLSLEVQDILPWFDSIRNHGYKKRVNQGFTQWGVLLEERRGSSERVPCMSLLRYA